MLKVWSRVRALSADDRSLVAEAAAQLLCAWLGLRVLSFARLRRLFSGAAVTRDRGRGAWPLDEVRRVAWAVSATARYLPVKATCLVEALAAEAMLRRRGCPCQLRFGVLPTSGGSRTPLSAHAWIEHDGVVMLGQLDNLSDYTVLSAPAGR